MNKILINGNEEACIDVLDRGFQYGDGVFETIVYKNGKLQLWDEHIQRIQQSAKRLKINTVEESVWLDDIKKLNITNDAVLKLILTRGISGRGYAYESGSVPTRVCAVFALPEYNESHQTGITARICETTVSMNASLAGIKHLNRLENVLARNEWNNKTIAEGLMLDINNHVIEGTMSNVFCVLEDELYTPSLEYSGVNGVVRQHIIKLAGENNIPVNVIELSKQNFLQMDSIFITNSVIGLWPVTKVIDMDQQYDFSIADTVKTIQASLNNSLNG